LIIDGLFFQQASVRHKELLTLLADGVRVVGCSSMGALRAAELYPFGMEGYGWVFESYRDGIIEADDEVGMVHGAAEDGYPVFVDALVNIRHTLEKAIDVGLLSPSIAAELITAARATPFTMRSWGRLLGRIGASDNGHLVERLRSLRVDIKHDDAVLALHRILAEPAGNITRPGPPPTVWSERWRQQWAPTTSVEPASADRGGVLAVEVSDLDVLSMLSVCANDRWAYVPALEQVAAWYWELRHPGSGETVRCRAAHAVADMACPSYRRALETVAHRYALATGVIDKSGFPEAVSSQWLTAEESHLPLDPIAISAKVTTRTLCFAQSLPAIQHFLDLMQTDPRLPEWRAMTAEALLTRDELARQKPHLNLSRPDPTQLRRIFALRWGVEVDRIELADRGLLTENAFYHAGTLFAVAAADDKLPHIEVGPLGREPAS
jgi:hypothetical protein